MWTSTLLNKSIWNRVKIIVCYALVWYDEWKSLRLYAIFSDSKAMVWDLNTMLWDFNSMLCYADVCCQRYACNDCIKSVKLHKKLDIVEKYPFILLMDWREKRYVYHF